MYQETVWFSKTW